MKDRLVVIGRSIKTVAVGVAKWWTKLFTDVATASAAMARFVRDEPLVSFLSVLAFVGFMIPRFLADKKYRFLGMLLSMFGGFAMAMMETVVV